MYGFNIIRDIKNMIKNLLSSYKLTNSVTFISHIINKIQNSTEYMFDYTNGNLSLSNNKEFVEEIFSKKITPLILLEIISTLLKLKEFKNLKEKGIHNYINKSIYYKEIFCVSDEGLESKIQKILQSKQSVEKSLKTELNKSLDTSYVSNSHELLQIKNRYSNKMFGEFDSTSFNMPEKISNLIVKFHHQDNLSNENNKTISFYNFLFELFKNKNSIREFAYIIKPLIYLIAMKKFGRKSLIPLLINAFLDYISLLKKDPHYNPDNEDSDESFSQKYLFSKEYQRRVNNLLTYLLRQPIVNYVTLPILNKTIGFILPKSVMDFINTIFDQMYISSILN